MADEELRKLMKRHKAFWEMEEVDRPLFSVTHYTPMTSVSEVPLRDGRIVSDSYLTPDMIDVEVMVRSLTQDTLRCGRVINGDSIRAFSPPDLCWTQAFLGCPIRVYHGCRWAYPFLKDLNDVEKLRLTDDNEWFQLYLEFIRQLVKASKGCFPISHGLFRGTLDMAASALGTNGLCVALYKEPKKFNRLLEVCADVIIKALKAYRAIAPDFHGGQILYAMWVPGTAARIQNDYAAILSPQNYREQVFAHDKRIVNASDYTVYHTHTASIHIAQHLVKMKNLCAIQSSIDYPSKGPTHKTLAMVIPIFRMIQKSKPLILHGVLTPKELSLLMRKLSPRGLSMSFEIRYAVEG